MNIFEMKDQLSQINRNLATIEQRVTPSVATRPVRYLPRVRLGSPGWLETLTGWIGGIEKWTGPLINLYQQLEQAGIITHAEAEKGLSKEELIALIKAMQPKPWYESWVPWVCGIATVGLVTGSIGFYVAKKKPKE